MTCSSSDAKTLAQKKGSDWVCANIFNALSLGTQASIFFFSFAIFILKDTFLKNSGDFLKDFFAAFNASFTNAYY